jgi:hypothetical protein
VRHRLNRYGAGRAMQPQRVTAGRDRGSDRNRVKQTRYVELCGVVTRRQVPLVVVSHGRVRVLLQGLELRLRIPPIDLDEVQACVDDDSG